MMPSIHLEGRGLPGSGSVCVVRLVAEDALAATGSLRGGVLAGVVVLGLVTAVALGGGVSSRGGGSAGAALGAGGSSGGASLGAAAVEVEAGAGAVSGEASRRR